MFWPQAGAVFLCGWGSEQERLLHLGSTRQCSTRTPGLAWWGWAQMHNTIVVECLLPYFSPEKAQLTACDSIGVFLCVKWYFQGLLMLCVKTPEDLTE